MQTTDTDLFDLSIAHLQTLYDKEVVKGLRRWLKHYKGDTSLLYSVAELKGAESEEPLKDKDNNITYASIKGALYIRLENEEIEYPWTVAWRALQVVGDMLEPCLPLGSVVDLKKDLLSSDFGLDIEGPLRLVITKRFLAIPGTLSYFPYGGEVYPLGSFGEAKLMYFSSALIESIVHTGFSDEMDDAFCLLMKKGLVIERGYHSLGFANEEERLKTQAIISKKE